ncbi:MarR family winged helix-turn-helix transcriptional regulator [Halocynthiibacter namhaensis]|uniref:MarR family winged helix-turn-helix transcriptional regulator n=1 Tax=Halocynthiibacter namhaensis TaxID=1290553 RepID=UPI00057959DB|nr:MarR family transcriptional regulator [Halocynthiibacter namhaensis]
MAQEPQYTDGYQLDDQIGYVLRLITQRHTAIFQECAQGILPGGLTPTQFSALLRIHSVGTCSQNRLGRMAAMDVATIKGVVDRLKRKGLIELAPDPEDRRRTKITLSETGEALIPLLKQTGTQITAETLKSLSDAEAEQLMILLKKML